MNTCCFGQNDPICHFSPGRQDLKSLWEAVTQAKCWLLPTTADKCSYIPGALLCGSMPFKNEFKFLKARSCTSNKFGTYIHYAKKLKEQTFDIRFFSHVRILGTWMLTGETSTSHNTQFLTQQEHLLHLATPKVSGILTRLTNLMSKVCSSNFFE